MSATTPTANLARDETSQVGGLHLHISVSVSLSDPRTGITVPLGMSSDEGKWTPLDLNGSTALDRSAREALINWLTQADIAGTSMLTEPDEAVAAVAETRQRCLLLAEQRRQTS